MWRFGKILKITQDHIIIHPHWLVVQILVDGVMNEKVEVMIEIALEVVLEGGVVDADKQVNTNSKGKWTRGDGQVYVSGCFIIMVLVGAAF